ncbi:MAG: VIT family protein [Kiritimatiellae bacterium]|jgi:VIT1/CCC1 family predicted Fe2+/Mn2+ transporter|nr:VIT family protein [Kiritimatiellia bacterium]
MAHKDAHRLHRTGWLRAAVMGANDGIVSTASLVIGVAAAHAVRGEILLAGIAGAVAGAMSMAAGEYVSVSSQSDTEKADLDLEKRHIKDNLEFEHKELAAIYQERGLEPDLALQVADQLMVHDALGAHARDELGIQDQFRARPIQAAVSSAAMFAVGAALPLLSIMAAPRSHVIPVVAVLSLLFLALLGSLAAHVGGASMVKGALRVTFWGALAMGLTAAVGTLFGVVVC